MPDVKTRVEDKQDKKLENLSVLQMNGACMWAHTHKRKLWGKICARDNKVLFDYCHSIK